MVKVQVDSEKIRWAFQYKECRIKVGFNFDQTVVSIQYKT